MDPLSDFPDPLHDLLSPSFFDDIDDICFFDQPAPHAPLLPANGASVLADANASCDNSPTFTGIYAGSLPGPLKRRYVGYNLDNFLRAGESESTSYVSKSTVGSAASATTTSCCNSSTASTNCRSKYSSKRSISREARRNMQSESKRRKEMTRLFHTLWSLLPTVIPRGNRLLMIDETCQYIRDLQKKLAILKLTKANVLAPTSNIGQWCEDGGGCNGNNVDITTLHSGETMTAALSCEIEPPYVRVTSMVEGNVKIIVGGYIRGPPRFFSNVLHILEMKGLDVTSANCSQAQDIVLYAIHACHPTCLSKQELGELQEIIYFAAESLL